METAVVMFPYPKTKSWQFEKWKIFFHYGGKASNQGSQISFGFFRKGIHCGMPLNPVIEENNNHSFTAKQETFMKSTVNQCLGV